MNSGQQSEEDQVDDAHTAKVKKVPVKVCNPSPLSIDGFYANRKYDA